MKRMTKKYTKITASLLAVIFLLGIFTACGNLSPEKVVTSFLEDWKNEKADSLTDYIVSDSEGKEFQDTLSEMTNPSNDSEKSLSDKTFQMFFSTLTYENVTLVEEEAESAKVEADLKTVDGEKIITELLQEMMFQAFSHIDEDLSEEELNNLTKPIMERHLANENPPMVDCHATFTLKKTDKGWKILLDSETIDALTGNLYSTMQSVD